jgi:hypothetical protein
MRKYNVMKISASPASYLPFKKPALIRQALTDAHTRMTKMLQFSRSPNSCKRRFGLLPG